MSQNLRELLITEAGYMNLITVDDMEDDFKELDSAYKLYISTGKVNRKVTRDDDDKEEKEEGKDDKEKDKDKDSDDDDKSGNIIVRAFKWIWNKITGFIKWIGGLFKKFWNWITGKKEDLDDKCDAIKKNGGDASDIEETAKAIMDSTSALTKEADALPDMEEGTKNGIIAGTLNAFAKICMFFTGETVKEEKEYCDTTSKVLAMCHARADAILDELGIQKVEGKGFIKRMEESIKNAVGVGGSAEGKKVQYYINVLYKEILEDFSNKKPTDDKEESAIAEHKNDIEVLNQVLPSKVGHVLKHESIKELKQEAKHINSNNEEESKKEIMEKLRRSAIVEEIALAFASKDVHSKLSAAEKAQLEKEKRQVKEQNKDLSKSASGLVKAQRESGAVYNDAFNKLMGLVKKYKLKVPDINLDNVVKQTKDLDGKVHTEINPEAFKNFSRYSKRVIEDAVAILSIKKKAYTAFFKLLTNDITNANKTNSEWVSSNEEFRNKYASHIKAIYDAHGTGNRATQIEKQALEKLYKREVKDIAPQVTDDNAIPIMLKREVNYNTEETRERDEDNKDVKKVAIKDIEYDNNAKVAYIDIKPVKGSKFPRTNLIWSKEEINISN